MTDNIRITDVNRGNPAENKQFAAISPGPIKPLAACFLASDWRATEKSSLLGFFTLTLPSGLVIKNCTYHKGPSGSRWVSLPAQTYKDKNGDIAYTSII